MSNNKQSIFKKTQLEQLEKSNNAAKQYLSRFRSAELRKKFLESQKIRQYQSEYNRLRDLVASKSNPAVGTIEFNAGKRSKELEQLGAKGLELIY
jgi:hypothetical protein